MSEARMIHPRSNHARKQADGRDFKDFPHDMEKILNEALREGQQELNALGRQLRDEWRARVRDNPFRRAIQTKRDMESEFFPRYRAIIQDAVRRVASQEAERFRNELIDQGLPEVPLTDSSRFDQSLDLIIDSAASEALNRELGNLLDQQADITRRTPQGREEAAGRLGLGTLAAGTMAAIVGKVIGAALNAGRDQVVTSLELHTRIREMGPIMATRNAVMDTNTCEECRRLDGTRVVYGSNEFHRLSPPSQCLGRSRCRCFWDVEFPDTPIE